jgi:hypothetical protein
VVPKGANEAKVDQLQLHGACIVQFGEDCHEGELHAKQVGLTNDDIEYVSPYNDSAILAGQVRHHPYLWLQEKTTDGRMKCRDLKSGRRVISCVCLDFSSAEATYNRVVTAAFQLLFTFFTKNSIFTSFREPLD